LQNNELSINAAKCVLGKKEVDYLGFTINSEGTKPLATRVEAVNNMSKPKDISGLRHFLRIINFYRRFPTPTDTTSRISNEYQKKR